MRQYRTRAIVGHSRLAEPVERDTAPKLPDLQVNPDTEVGEPKLAVIFGITTTITKEKIAKSIIGFLIRTSSLSPERG